MADTEKELIEKLQRWKSGLKTNGMKVKVVSEWGEREAERVRKMALCCM